MSDEMAASPSATDGFHKSLSALRRILLLDSPTAGLLKGPSSANDMERARLRKELRLVKESLESSKTRVDLLEEQLEKTSEEARQEQSCREAAEKKHASLVHNNQELTAQLETATARSQELQGQISLLEGRVKTQQKDYFDAIAQLNQQLEQARQEANDAVQLGGITEAQLETSERKMQEMEKELQAATRNFKTERIQLQGTIQSLERSIEILRGRLAASDSTTEKVKELETATLELGRTKGALEQAKADLKSVTESKAQVQGNLQRYMADLEEKKTQIGSLEEALRCKEHELEEAKKQAVALEHDIKKQRTEFTESIAEKEQAAKAVQKESSEALTALQRKLEKRKEEAQQTQTKLETDLKEAKSELTAKVSLVERHEKLIKLFKNKVSALESKVKGLGENEETASLKQELETAKAKTKQAEADWTAKFNSMSEELTETKEELQLAEQEVSRCRARIAELEACALTSNQEELDKLKTSSEEQLRALQEKLTQSEAALKTAQADSKAQIERLNEIVEQKDQELQGAKNLATTLQQDIEKQMESLMAAQSSGGTQDSEQQLQRKDEEVKQIQTQHQEEIKKIKSELQAKESLIQNQEKRIKLLKAKTGALEKRVDEGSEADKEAIGVLKQALETAQASAEQSESEWSAKLGSIRLELGNTRESLRIAREEVTRYQGRIAELEERSHVHDDLGDVMETVADEDDETGSSRETTEQPQENYPQATPDAEPHNDFVQQDVSATLPTVGAVHPSKKRSASGIASEETSAVGIVSANETPQPDQKKIRSGSDDLSSIRAKLLAKKRNANI